MIGKNKYFQPFIFHFLITFMFASRIYAVSSLCPNFGIFLGGSLLAKLGEIHHGVVCFLSALS